MDYKKLYHIMVDASERALQALEQQRPYEAWSILSKGERDAEEKYISMSEEENAENT